VNEKLSTEEAQTHLMKILTRERDAFADRRDERLEVVEINLVSGGRAVLLAPLKKLVEQSDRCRGREFAGSLQRLAKLGPPVPGFVSLVFTFDEPDLTTPAVLADVGVPPTIRRAEPRF
jgi:hypothetical protein